MSTLHRTVDLSTLTESEAQEILELLKIQDDDRDDLSLYVSPLQKKVREALDRVLPLAEPLKYGARVKIRDTLYARVGQGKPWVRVSGYVTDRTPLTFTWDEIQ